MRNSLQRLSAILLCVYCATAKPQIPSKEYLPAHQEGYQYNSPSIPFPSAQPTYRPPPPPPPPIYSSPAPIYSSPAPIYSSPAPIYSSPAPIYSSPAPIYSTPAPIYSTPAPVYSTPRPTYIPPKPTYGTPFESGSAISPVGQEGAGIGGGEFDHLRQPHVPGMPFDFAYNVRDDYYGNDFGHQASSNGDQVRGEYRTLLPDGRMQIVKYIADWKDGYTAEVTYQGEAKYPQQPASGGAIAPVSQGSSGSAIDSASQSFNGGNYQGGQSGYAPSGYRPSVPFPQPSPGYPSQASLKPSYQKPSYQQPGPSIAPYPSISSPRPTGISGNGYGQQPVSGYGGSANQAYSASTPAPSFSPTSDYGNYKK